MAAKIQSINPIMIMVFIPLFNGVKTIEWPFVDEQGLDAHSIAENRAGLLSLCQHF